MKPNRNLVRAGVFLAAIFGVAVASRWLGTLPAAPAQLTGYPGFEMDPAFSPDGRQLAFSWSGDKEANFDIYVRPVEGGDPVRLTRDPGRDFAPEWSPDGRSLAFCRLSQKPGDSGASVFVVPASGGPERLVTELDVPYVDPRLGMRRLSWTPDGQSLVVPHRSSEADAAGLALVSVDSGERRMLTVPPAGYSADRQGLISPDGRNLAFLRSPAYLMQDLYVQPLGPNYQPQGEPRRFTRTGCCIEAFVWSEDGTGLLFARRRGDGAELWLAPLPPGSAPRLVRSLKNVGKAIAISPQGDRLAFSDHILEEDVWRLKLDSPAGTSPQRFLSSNHLDIDPRFSPDGRRVAYASSRSGALELYVCDSDGQNPQQLTSLSSPLLGSPRWSPDGTQIVFDARLEGNSDIYVVGAAGGKPRRVTTNPAAEYSPSWSHDGRSIYFSSNRSGQRQIWKIGADGTGPEIQVTKGGGWAGFESPDGRFLYYTRAFRNTSLWRVPAGGGEEVRIVPSVNQLNNFAVTGEGVYYQTSLDDRPGIDIWFLPFAAGKPELVARLDGWTGRGMTVSPDRRTLLFTEVEERGGDLWMIDHLR